MTKFHRELRHQTARGQGLRRSNSIGGMTRLTRRRLRRQQRRSNPYPAVVSLARTNHVSLTRGHFLPSSETERGRENSSSGRYSMSEFCHDDRLNLSWTVTDVSTPQGRKLIIRRCGVVKKGYPKDKFPRVTCDSRNGKRRKRLESMCPNYSYRISSSDESVEESVDEGVKEGVEEGDLRKHFDQDTLLSPRNEDGITWGRKAARESDVTLTDCRRLRRENTVILDHDESVDDVQGNQTVRNDVTKPVAEPVTQPVTNMFYNNFVNFLDRGTEHHQHKDMLETSAERFSYKKLLKPVEHFRCVLCDTNLEALTLGTDGESRDILDLSRFHIEDGRSDVTLSCPECGFSQICYR